MKYARFLCFAFLIFIFAFSTLVYADVPQMINYQGKITTPAGALVDTAVQMTFTIYDDSTSGNVLWADTLGSVAVEKGIFSVLLGSANPIPDSVFDGNVRYLGVKVGADTEMTPRKAMVSVPYALHTGGDGDWTISGSDMYSAVSGNVGIGTTSPSFWAKLHVTTPVVTTIRLSTPSNDFSGMSGIRLDAPAHDWLIANENQLSNGLLFLDVTASQDRLFIDTDGNVGVGTTSPSEKLTVNGDIDMIKGQSRIHGTGEISFDWSAGSTYDNPSYHGVQSKDEAGSWGDEIRINSMNDIINTVDANDNDATSYYKVQHHSTGDGEDLFWVRSSDGNAYHKGNVGIGITNPTQKLDVAGTAKATDFECSGCIDAGDIDANQVQRRVSGSCSAGSSIRIINSDGTVTCETDDAGDTVASCSDVDNCSYTGSIRHFEWMSSINGATDIYDNTYVKIQRISSNTTFRLYCGHGSGCTYVYYKNGSRTAGTLSNGGTVDITMTPDGSDCRFLFAKTMNGMDMLVCDVFNTNNPYMHFICHDTK